MKIQFNQAHIEFHQMWGSNDERIAHSNRDGSYLNHQMVLWFERKQLSHEISIRTIWWKVFSNSRFNPSYFCLDIEPNYLLRNSPMAASLKDPCRSISLNFFTAIEPADPLHLFEFSNPLKKHLKSSYSIVHSFIMRELKSWMATLSVYKDNNSHGESLWYSQLVIFIIIITITIIITHTLIQ